MSIQYTPYYNHYFHLLSVLEQEHRDKSTTHAKLKARIFERLEERTTAI